MNLFEQRVKEYGREFFQAGGRELLEDLESWGLKSTKDTYDAVHSVLKNALKVEREKILSDPSAINDLRSELKKALGL